MNSESTAATSLFGIAAEFPSGEALLEAARRMRAEGFVHYDAYTPMPVDGLSEVLGYTRSRVPLIVLCGGIMGGLTGFFMLWYANVISYPWNVGGRPPNSWPAWIPITFELTVLGAGLFSVFGMLLLNGLPQPYHPMFNVPGFEQASRGRFFLCIERIDPKFDPATTRQFLESLHPLSVSEVPQ